MLRKRCFFINKLVFSDIEEFVDKVSEDFNSISEEFKDISIIAQYEEAKEVIQGLISLGYSINSINGLENPEYGGYSDELIISLAEIKNEEVWVEPFKRETGYITDESVITYVFDNCNSKCLKGIKSKLVYEISIEEDCDYTEDYSLDTSEGENTYISRDKDGKVSGFSKTWTTTKDNVTCTSSYSHYSTDEDMVKKIARDFGIDL